MYIQGIKFSNKSSDKISFSNYFSISKRLESNENFKRTLKFRFSNKNLKFLHTRKEKEQEIFRITGKYLISCLTIGILWSRVPILKF